MDIFALILFTIVVDEYFPIPETVLYVIL